MYNFGSIVKIAIAALPAYVSWFAFGARDYLAALSP